MSSVSGMLKIAFKEVQSSLKSIGREIDVDELEDIVTTHACSAAVAAAATGWFTGVGSAIATATGLGFVVAMYIRLGAAMGITWHKGMIRAVASSVIADISAYLATVITASALISFVPILGNLGSSTITAITNFAFVYLAAIIYVKLLSKLINKGVNLSTVDAETLKAEAKQATQETDMKTALQEAREEYKKAKDNNELKSTVEPDKETSKNE